MTVTKKEVAELVSATESQIQKLKDTPDLQTRMREVHEGFKRLLASPFIDESRYQSLVGDVNRIFIDKQRRDFERMPQRRVEHLVLDTDERVIAYSERDRAGGESDLYHERDTQSKEEGYLFVRFTDKGGKTKTAWIEVANEEKENRASIPVFLVGGILKKYSEMGQILEASLYHYHPNTPPEELRGMHESRISSIDLYAAAQYSQQVGRVLPVQLDFRVINRDGIYSFSGVTFEKLDRFSQIDLYRVNALEGSQLVNFLRNHGIECTFQAREQKLPIRQP